MGWAAASIWGRGGRGLSCFVCFWFCLPFFAVVADLVDPDWQLLARLRQNLRYWQNKKNAERWLATAQLQGPLQRPVS